VLLAGAVPAFVLDAPFLAVKAVAAAPRRTIRVSWALLHG